MFDATLKTLELCHNWQLSSEFSLAFLKLDVISSTRVEPACSLGNERPFFLTFYLTVGATNETLLKTLNHKESRVGRQQQRLSPPSSPRPPPPLPSQLLATKLWPYWLDLAVAVLSRVKDTNLQTVRSVRAPVCRQRPFSGSRPPAPPPPTLLAIYFWARCEVGGHLGASDEKSAVPSGNGEQKRRKMRHRCFFSATTVQDFWQTFRQRPSKSANFASKFRWRYLPNGHFCNPR